MARADENAESREALIDRLESKIEAQRGDLERRHWIQALATVGLVGSGAREMYRKEYLDALPSLRYRPSAGEGHWEMTWKPNPDEVPEGATPGGAYALVLVLASVGGRRRASEKPLLSLLAAGATMAQAGAALKRSIEEFERGGVDVFSSIDTVLSASTIPLVLPEALRAAKQLVGRG